MAARSARKLSLAGILVGATAMKMLFGFGSKTPAFSFRF